MTDTTYNDLHEFVMQGAGWVPNNQNAQELMEQTSPGEVQMFKEISTRDVPFHRCYFSLLNYIWGYMPNHFKAKVPCAKFYLWLKHLKKEYDIIFEYADGTVCIEYKSVSFGRMTQIQFENYVREQLPFIYSHVIGLMYSGDRFDDIVDTIEKDYSSFFAKL